MAFGDGSSGTPNYTEAFGSLAALGVGLGFNIAGSQESMAGARAYNAAQIASIDIQEQQDAVRQRQMEVSSDRMKLQNMRQQQQAAALATANAAGQGALYGSGLQGGRSQVRSQGGYNELGINQNLAFGEQMFALNKQLNAQKIAQANAQMQIQEGQAKSAFGGNITSIAGTVGKLATSLAPLLAL